MMPGTYDASLEHLASRGPDDPKSALVAALAAAPALRPGRGTAADLLEHLRSNGWEITPTAAERPARVEVVRVEPPAPRDPQPWTDYSSVIADLLNGGYAAPRSRVNAALAALALDPDEVRAVVIEPTTVHVFRYSDRTHHQHQPILEGQ